MSSVVDQKLQKYTVATQEDAAQALREVMQEIALAGLNRGGFFDKAAFYGGTCLGFSTACRAFQKILIFHCCIRSRIFHSPTISGA